MSGISLMTLGPFVPTGGNIAGAFDLSYVYHDPGNAMFYPNSLATGTNTENFSGTAMTFVPETRPSGGFFIDPTGTYLYVTGDNEVSGTAGTKQYTMSTTWDLTTANKSTETTISSYGDRGISFSPDGTKMFLNIQLLLRRYDLSTAWDITTAVYNPDEISSGLTTIGPSVFSTDGTKVFWVSRSSLDATVRLYQYSLSTAWDLSSATLEVSNFVTAVPTTIPTAGSFISITAHIYFNEDGTLLTVWGNDVAVYSLSVGFDLSSTVTLLTTIASGPVVGVSAGYAITSFRTFGSYRYSPIYFAQNGSDSLTNSIRVLSLGTFLSQTGDSSGIFFKPDGTKMFVSDSADNKVYSYSLSTAWDTSSAVYQSGEDLSLAGARSIFFKPDGTKAFFSTASNFYEYALSTPWDLSSATLSNTITATDLGQSSNTLRNFFFSPDGTTLLYALVNSSIGGSTISDPIRKLTLGSAWDFGSGITISGEYISVSAQDTAPTSVWANTDGTKLFVYGSTNSDLHQYELSTAWDLSSATFSKTFLSASWLDSPTATSAFFMDATGSKLFMLGDGCVFRFGMQDRGF